MNWYKRPSGNSLRYEAGNIKIALQSCWNRMNNNPSLKGTILYSEEHNHYIRTLADIEKDENLWFKEFLDEYGFSPSIKPDFEIENMWSVLEIL